MAQMESTLRLAKPQTGHTRPRGPAHALHHAAGGTFAWLCMTFERVRAEQDAFYLSVSACAVAQCHPQQDDEMCRNTPLTGAITGC